MSSEKIKLLADKIKNITKENENKEASINSTIEEKEEDIIKDELKENENKEASINSTIEEEEEIINDELTKASVKKNKRLKKNSLEYTLKFLKETEFNNKERVYIDSGISNKLKLLKLGTGVSIGTLANVLLDIALKENEDYVKSKIAKILNM